VAYVIAAIIVAPPTSTMAGVAGKSVVKISPPLASASKLGSRVQRVSLESVSFLGVPFFMMIFLS
jgi:hypothetical protein